MATGTRSKSDIWLVGSEENQITGSKLPSNGQVLSYFFHHHKTLKMTVRYSSTVVVKDVAEYWAKARIPIRQEQHCISKVEQLFNRWAGLKKNAKRRTDTQRANEAAFVDELDNLFDIAHMDALSLIKIHEDKQFLLAQRQPGRQGCMGSVDQTLTLQEARTAKRKEAVINYKQRADKEEQMLSESVILSSSSDDSASEEVTDAGQDGQSNDESTAASVPAKKRSRKSVMTPVLAAALDRTKLSDRKATFVLAAAAQSLGHDVNDYSINRSSIHRQREQIREELAKNLKSEFRPTVPLVVHWDGKMLSDLTGKELVDRLPVVVSGAGVDQLLGVPKMPSGTGDAQATAVAKVLQEWGLVNRVSAMCFDTTSSNTGRINGSCVLLEHKLDKDLLYLACRHHILELVLASVFKESSAAASSGPDVAIFKRFQQSWSYIAQNCYDSGDQHQLVSHAVADTKDAVVEFVLGQLSDGKTQPRDDYRELLELTLIFLGVTPPRGVKFMAPGAFHQARWLSKAIYSIKIWLFRNQFSLTIREEKGLRDVCIFIVSVYVKQWYTAPLAASAPHNDLLFLQQLVAYESVNPALSKVASSKFAGHLRYLSEVLVGLAFYDPAVSAESKRAMVKATKEKQGIDEPAKRVQIDLKQCVNMAVEDFVTTGTLSFFEKLQLPVGFLDVDVASWNDTAEYQQGLNIVHKLRVVNDTAERAVALIEEYNDILTRKETQKQYLLQIVKQHRGHFPDCSKQNLSDN